MSKNATPPARTKPLKGLGEGARYGIDALRRHGLRLVILFAALLLPLWLFGELADEVREGETFFFDKPILQWLHARHSETWDAVFLFFSRIGYEWGVIPIDIALVLVLAFKRKWREGLFAGIALGGSAILNVAAKHYFGRARPSLWESIEPEGTYSFPSGHAMGSMTLAAVLLLLAWPTRWRWPVIVVMAIFVPMVGISRLYLGVHYPSDILAGWSAALAWVVGVYLVLFATRKLA
ncbi:MAG: phosphatase PAP2 family protein [Pseudomonadota bacterium]|nr:phosphatase PAP2 family protein [Pseudomonadota bacterium]